MKANHYNAIALDIIQTLKCHKLLNQNQEKDNRAIVIEMGITKMTTTDITRVTVIPVPDREGDDDDSDTKRSTTKTTTKAR
jgi:hypothetical protein